MADFRWYRRQVSHLLSVERRFLHGARGPLDRARLQLLEAVLKYGLSDAALIFELDHAYNFLGRELGALGAELAPLVIHHTEQGVRSQLRQMQDAPPMDELRGPWDAENVANLTHGLPSWLVSQKAAELAEISRLRLSGEPIEQAALSLYGLELETGRASTWRKGLNRLDLATTAAVFGASAALVGGWMMRSAELGRKIQKQAFAAIDERTTDCCLRVTGQIQDQDKPFKLTGTPRYADRMMRPPFHYRCRTATALYTPSMDGIGMSTGDIRASARAELEARAKSGKRVEIHPAHATSKRTN